MFQGAPLVLLAPCGDNNFGRSATRSTTLAILREVSRAGRLLETIGTTALEEVLEEFTPSGFSHDTVLEVEVVLPAKKPGTHVADAKNASIAAILYTVVDMEHRVGDPSRIRPLLRPTRKSNKFVWMVLLQATEQDLGDDWTDRKRDEMQASLASHGAAVDFRMKK